MPNYPYIIKTGTLKAVLDKIQRNSVPEKFTLRHLQALGFKSPNDRPVIPVLKFIKFLGEDGKPTEIYEKYRDTSKAKKILASAIRAGYSSLFSMYSDADQRDEETLRNFFSANTKVGDRALKSMVHTFKTICELGDFKKSEGKGFAEKGIAEKSGLKESVQDIDQRRHMPININIELQIPATDNADIYDKFFAALKKHLLD